MQIEANCVSQWDYWGVKSTRAQISKRLDWRGYNWSYNVTAEAMAGPEEWRVLVNQLSGGKDEPWKVWKQGDLMSIKKKKESTKTTRKSES